MITLILDIDGTLASTAARDHFLKESPPNWDQFLNPELMLQDEVIPGSQRGVDLLLKLCKDLWFLTGRNEGLRECTTMWLKKHFGLTANTQNLLMRPKGNFDLPTVYKAGQLDMIKDRNSIPNDYINSSWLCIDDDPYMHPVYSQFRAISLLAPDCWKCLFPTFENLPDEVAWRK